MFFWQDLQQAWRSLIASWGFLVLSAGVLALGLATTIFMYGAIRTMLDQPPPYPQADRLISLNDTDPARGFDGVDLSLPDLAEYNAQQKSVERLVGLYTGTMTLSGAGLPERYSGAFVTPGYFEMIRVKPVLGRDFLDAEFPQGAASVVVISHGLWKSRFAGATDVIGKTVRVNGELTTIVGVMPEGFALPTPLETMWKPIRRDPANETRGSMDALTVEAYGRLRDDVTLAQAQADFERIGAQLAQRYPEFKTGRVPRARTLTDRLAGDDGAKILRLLFYVVWGVLAIACANVASLIFVRANQRSYEASMRAALGATRLRLVSLTIAESMIIAGLGALIGLALAAIGFDVMTHVMRTQFEGAPAWWVYRIDWVIAAFAFGVAMLAGLVAGFWPAWRASRPDIMKVLRDGGRTGTGMRLSMFTSVMVVVEVALAIALLSAAGVATRTALETLNSSYGVDSSGYMTGRVMLPEARYDAPAQAAFIARAVGELQSQQGVVTATASTVLPGAGTGEAYVAIEGRRYSTTADYSLVPAVAVMPKFFAGFGLAPRAGREFSDADRIGTTPVALVNEAFVQQHFAAEEPLGKRIRYNADDPSSPWLTIVGVVPNVMHDPIWDVVGRYEPVIYYSLLQIPERFVSLAIRVDGDPHRHVETLRRTVARLDGEIPVYFLGTLIERQDIDRGGMKVVAGLFVIFAVVAILLATAGLYGVLSFTTGQRTREIGIRRALGAHSGRILQGVLRGALIQLGIGVAIGALLAPLLVGVLPPFITGGIPHDVLVYGTVTALVAICALLASWVPARRALRVQPAVALRYE
jgi:putative ABC transport system permease protein